MPEVFEDRLQAELTSLALCWRLVRSDCVALGFTTHDAPLDIEGLRYVSVPGMSPSAIALSDGLDVDTMDVEGALTADAISARDLASGRFDAASVQIFMVDWSCPAAGRLPLARGRLGEVARRSSGSGGSFTAALRGPTADFEALSIEAYSPECRAELGDARCRVDLARCSWRSKIVSVISRQKVEVDAGAVSPGYFEGGRLRPLNGSNSGIDARIAAVEGSVLTLIEPLPFEILVGCRVELREGCDKRLQTCSNRFANVANFRGEPHVPGGDVLTRFPGV